METLERLEVELRLNREQFTKELGTIQGQLSGLTQVTNKTSSAVGGNLVGSMIKGNIATQLILGTVTKLANGVFGLTKNLMASGSQLSRLKIATNTVARNLGITTEEVDGLRDSLAESNTYGIKAENVIRTLAMSGLMDMAKSLEAVDGRTGELSTGINALVLTMKDLSSVAGLDSSEGIERVTRFINRGEAASVEGMIAIGNLGTEYRMFAKTLGKSRDELTAVEEAQARMNLVMREGKKAFGAYADTYTTSGKMLSSIRDATTSIFEELGGALEPLWASVSSAILNFVQGVRNFLVDNTETIRAWASRVAGWVVWLVRTIGAWLSKLPAIGSYFGKLANFEIKSAKGTQAGTVAREEQTEAMDNATGSAKSLKKALAGLAQFDEMTVLKQQESSGGGGGVSSSIGTADTTATGGGLLAGIDTAINNFAGGIAEKMQPIIDKIKEFMKPIVELWNTWVKPAFDGLLAVIKELWDSIINSPVGEILKTIAQILGVIIVVAIGVVINALTGLVAIIKWHFEQWKASFDKTVEMFANMIIWVRNLGDKINEVWTNVKNWFISIWTSITDWFNKKIAEIKQGWEVLGLLVGVVIENMKNTIHTKIENIKNFFVGIFDTAKSVFNNIKSTVSSIVSSLVDSVQDKIASMKQGFIDLGNKIVTSVKDPINQVIVKINSFLGKIRGINIAGLSLNIPDIPKLATGGVVNSPTIALLGEAGKEAVVPLENNTEWIDKLARELGGRNGGIINLTVQVGDEKIGERMIDYMNDKALRTGSNLLVM